MTLLRRVPAMIVTTASIGSTNLQTALGAVLSHNTYIGGFDTDTNEAIDVIVIHVPYLEIRKWYM